MSNRVTHPPPSAGFLGPRPPFLCRGSSRYPARLGAGGEIPAPELSCASGWQPYSPEKTALVNVAGRGLRWGGKLRGWVGRERDGVLRAGFRDEVWVRELFGRAGGHQRGYLGGRWCGRGDGDGDGD